jgi:hypothetical protein
MATLPKYFSATSIKLYLECPSCWHRRYVLKDRDAGIGHMGRLLYGQAVGSTLQDFHLGMDVERSWAKWYQHFVDVAGLRNESLPQTFEWGLVAFRAYLKDPMLGEPEKTVWPTIGGQCVQGRMDLVGLKRGKPHYIGEYKTSAAKWDQERVDTELQATIYWEGFTQEYGYEPKSVEYVIFPTGGDRPDPYQLSTVRTEAQRRGVSGLVEGVAHAVEADNFEPKCRECRIENGLLIPRTKDHSHDPVFFVPEDE